MKNIQEVLDMLDYPTGDDITCATSKSQFTAGGQYGIEIPSVNNLEILESLICFADQLKIPIDRIVECRGIFRLPDDEIKQMVRVCMKRQIGFIMSVGPRAIYDTGSFAKSKNGARIGYRLRGMKNIVHALQDVRRAVELGVRGFMVYDEGLLHLLKQMREKGELPVSSVFKFSVHACCSNPVSAKLFEGVGADTINPIPDLDIPMLASIRQTVSCPLDVFTDTSSDAGGLLRTYDVPEFIRVASPVYLKCGSVSQQNQNHLPSQAELLERVKQVRCVVEVIERYIPDALPVNKNERTLAIPSD